MVPYWQCNAQFRTVGTASRPRGRPPAPTVLTKAFGGQIIKDGLLSPRSIVRRATRLRHCGPQAAGGSGAACGGRSPAERDIPKESHNNDWNSRPQSAAVSPVRVTGEFNPHSYVLDEERRNLRLARRECPIIRQLPPNSNLSGSKPMFIGPARIAAHPPSRASGLRPAAPPGAPRFCSPPRAGSVSAGRCRSHGAGDAESGAHAADLFRQGHRGHHRRARFPPTIPSDRIPGPPVRVFVAKAAPSVGRLRRIERGEHAERTRTLLSRQWPAPGDQPQNQEIRGATAPTSSALPPATPDCDPPAASVPHSPHTADPSLPTGRTPRVPHLSRRWRSSGGAAAGSRAR